jgi:hypothetical protein
VPFVKGFFPIWLKPSPTLTACLRQGLLSHLAKACTKSEGLPFV